MKRESTGYLETLNLVLKFRMTFRSVMTPSLSLNQRNMWKSKDKRRIHAAGQ